MGGIGEETSPFSPRGLDLPAGPWLALPLPPLSHAGTFMSCWDTFSGGDSRDGDPRARFGVPQDAVAGLGRRGMAEHRGVPSIPARLRTEQQGADGKAGPPGAR